MVIYTHYKNKNNYEIRKTSTRSFRQIRPIIKRFKKSNKNGKQQEALNYMENGPLKERFEELQNIITIAGGPGELGARGVQNTGTL